MVTSDTKHIIGEKSPDLTYPERPSSSIDFSQSEIAKKIKLWRS